MHLVGFIIRKKFTCLTLKTLTEGVRGNGAVEDVWACDRGKKSGTETNEHSSVIIRTFQKARFIGVIKLRRLRMATQALTRSKVTR